MNERIHRATKTRSNRPGWSVTFSHPRRRDARGKFGLKVRRGLGTTDDTEAANLVDQINELLADESWWSIDRRTEADKRFDSIAVSAFFDGIETGTVPAKDLRERIIPMPSQEEGYARVMLVGSTGAGKTTLLRQLIGSDHKQDRFPSTSTAKTTTADIEIITAHESFEAVVTFMSEHEVRCSVDECLEDACIAVVHGHDDSRVAEALLEHREQRFRLSYPLGSWQQELPKQGREDEFSFDFGDEDESGTLAEGESVPNDEITANKELLLKFVSRIRQVSLTTSQILAQNMGDFQEMSNANQRQEWLEAFTDSLYDNQDFGQISLDIMDAIKDRFDLVEAGAFEHSSTTWPALWYYEERDRDTFLQQVRWFTGNHGQQFGRLLTPLVDGIRVRGAFKPAAIELRDDERKLVLLDGEGLGHSAKEATSVSTKVTERFQEADMILLVDNSQSPMQAAPIELLRSVGSSGHGHKLSVVFTHFDLVKGDNLGSFEQKRNHVRASVGNAIASLRESLGAPVTEILEKQLEHNDFYLGGLNLVTSRIPSGYVKEMSALMDRMKGAAVMPEPVDAAPIYSVGRLELVLRDAADGFKEPWKGRLGLSYHEGIRKEHWARVKALCRRISNLWDKEYNGLRPVADMVRQLQTGISLWLDSPSGWTRQPVDEDERQTVINTIRQRVFLRIHSLSERRVINTQLGGWRSAWGFSGSGSSYDRAKVMGRIYDTAAPSISSAMDADSQDFLDQVIQIVRESVEESGGSIEGVSRREPAEVA